MALCQYFLGNNMASSSHVTAANQSKSGPELAKLSLYTALVECSTLSKRASKFLENVGSVRIMARSHGNRCGSHTGFGGNGT